MMKPKAKLVVWIGLGTLLFYLMFSTFFPGRSLAQFWTPPSWRSPAVAQTSSPNGVPIDYTLLNDFLQTSPIPVRLPAVVVSSRLRLEPIYYGTGGQTTNPQGQYRGYRVMIQANPTSCLGAASCSVAYAEAHGINPGDPSIEDVYGWLNDPSRTANYIVPPEHAAGWVSLSDGTQIYLVPAVEGGAGGGWEQAVWDESRSEGSSFRYTIALKRGTADDILQMMERVDSYGAGAGDSWGGLQEPVDSSTSWQ